MPVDNGFWVAGGRYVCMYIHTQGAYNYLLSILLNCIHRFVSRKAG
jgi:hypothetical protein